MCAWLRFLGVSPRYAVVLVLCLVVSYLRSYVCYVYLGTIVLLLLSLITLLLLPAGVQKPGFGWVHVLFLNPGHSRVHTLFLNPGYCRVHTIPLNPDLHRVHHLLLGYELWFARPRVHISFFTFVSIPDRPRFWQNMFICHRVHRLPGRTCGY